MTDKKCFIMQGCSGSGKSTRARELVESGGEIFSSDEFFVTEGVYLFNGRLLGKAHEWNRKRAVAAMEAGVQTVVIDNTNTQAWEARDYVKTAIANGYNIEFVRPGTAWENDAEECARRNTHGVPLKACKRMIERMEELGVRACLNSFAPWEVVF